MGAVILALTVLCCGPPAAPEPAITVTVLEPEPASPAAAPTVPTVEQLIRAAAARYGVNAERAVRVARCESRLGADPRAYFWSAPHRGVYQWDRPSWNERAPLAGVSPDWAAAFNDRANIEVALSTMAAGQWGRWWCK
jgi:hypothetical protein